MSATSILYAALCALFVGMACCLLVLKWMTRIQNDRSPIPWIAAPVWSALQSRIVHQPPLPTLFEPQLCPVDADKRAHANHLVGELDMAVVPQQDQAQATLTLQSLQARFCIAYPRWPYCCERLSSLIRVHQHGFTLTQIQTLLNDIPLSADTCLSTDEDVIAWTTLVQELQAGTHSGEGIAWYLCSQCHHLYISSCGPQHFRS